MKKAKLILALVLVAALFVSLFAACAQSEEPAATPGTDTPGTDTPGTDTPDANAPEDGEIDYGEETEAAEVVFYMYDLRSTGADHGERINAAVNAITEPEGLHLDIRWVTMGDWQTAVLLALSSGERMDVITCSMFGGVGTFYAKNQLLDITDYMNETAPETMELMGEYLGAYTFSGKLYGVPTYRNYCKDGYILMNAEVLDELGLREQAENMTCWSDYEAILAAVTEAKNPEGLWATGGVGLISSNNWLATGDSWDDYDIFDNLSDGQNVIWSDMDGNVGLYQAQPGYEYEVSMMADWAEKGYIWPDSPFTTEFQDDLMKNQVIFSVVQGSEIGVETTKSESYGYEVVATQFCGSMIKTGQLTSWGLAVPVTAEEPEAACRFINMLYTNEDLMNTMIWGVEGEDYTVENGEVVQGESGYYYEADFLIGNNALLTPLAGNGADFYEVVKATNDAAVRSPYMGFTIDTTDMDLLMSQISAVYDQYSQAMNGGGYTPEYYQEYLTQLEAAGVQDYIDQIQAQLDAWLAAQ